MKLEKEIKVLGIDIDATKDALAKLGAEFLYETRQKIYTYDLQSIFSRYLDIVKAIEQADNELLLNANKLKLKSLLVEIEDLIADSEIVDICKAYNLKSLDLITL